MQDDLHALMQEMHPDAAPQPHRAAQANADRRTRDPFSNPTEEDDYRTDYTDLAPELLIPDTTLPVIPSPQEASRIRRTYNRAGLGLLLHVLLTNVFALVLYLVVQLLLKRQDLKTLDVLPENYSDILTRYINDSSLAMAINLMLFLSCNVAVFFIGCALSKIRVRSLFAPLHISALTLFRYIGLGLFIQSIASILALIAEKMMSGIGYTPYTPDFSTGTSPLKIAATVLCTCVMAPITEELLYRGFFLKAMSRVSQRFAIFASALFFGLAHENVSQFILSFLVGILLGYITVKYNSLLPAMMVHFSINTYSTIISVLSEFNETAAGAVYAVCSLIFLFGGLILFIYTCVTERLPDNTPHQSIRCGRIAITSWALVLTAVLHIGFSILNSL